MKKIEDPAFDLVTNKELIELGKKPVELCKKYDIPYIFIDGVTSKKEGRTTTFEYKDKNYKIIELVALDYYKNLGYDGLFTDGSSVLMINQSIKAAVINRVKSLFELIPESEWVDINGNLSKFFSMLSPEEKAERYNKLRIAFEKFGVELLGSIKYYLCSMRAISGSNSSKENYEVDRQSALENFQKQAIKLLVKPEELKEEMLKKFEEIANDPPLEEFEKYMNEVIEEAKARYPDPRMQYRILGMNEWSLNFALKVIKTVGIKYFGNFLREEIPDLTGSLSNFDLILLDEKNKSLKFVEVKNKDDFTPAQILYIDLWLKESPEKRGNFELCVARSA